ncbi:MAG: GNAT family N-acetyltransferase [Alphaproteobacteria bacterium]|nr:GNAT family N-acetyltransferase [Alphaproteobacteria bacterium]
MPSIDFEARRAWFVDHLIGLRDRGAVVACAFDVASGEMAGFYTLDAKGGHIDQLAVAPTHWGTPAASTLLEDAMSRAPGTLRLEVNQENPRAIRFYEKHGFRRRAAGVNPSSGLRTWHYQWTQR